MPSGVTISGHGFSGPQVERAFREAAEEQMRRGVLAAQGEIQRRTPFRTGHLRRSITSVVVRAGNVITGTIGTVVRYGLWIDQGTGVYGPRGRPIVPVKAKALRFPAGGQASVFQGAARTQGSAGPGFRLSGQQRAGKAGAGAQYAFRRSVKGVRPRRFFEDGMEVAAGAVRREIMLIPVVARRKLADITRGGPRGIDTRSRTARL